MAREFKLLSVLWLVAACIGTAVESSIATPATTTTVESTTTTPATTTTVESTTTPATTTTVESTTTTPATTTVESTTTTPATTTTAVQSTITTPATTAATTTTVESTTTTPATTTVESTTTTPATTTTVESTTTTPATTTTAVQSTTTTSTTTAATTTTATTPTAGLNTTTPPSSITTAGSVGPSTSPSPSSTTPDLTTTKLPDPCEANPCGDGSTCEPRVNQTFVCLCLAGDFYNDTRKSCENAKVFPGELDLPGLQYTDGMSIKTSSAFEDASQKVIDQLSSIFGKPDGYSGSTVLELRPISKVWSRSETGVNADLEIAFTPNSDIKTDDITKRIVNAGTCDACLLADATFKVVPLCQKNPCDDNTAICSEKDGSYNCTCRENYIKTDFSSRMCTACPSGQKYEDSVCVNCPFGYSGINCNESWQLVLVIVGSVLGGLLLITLILLPIVACKCSKKSSKKNKNVDIGKPYVTHSAAKAPLVNHSLANSQAASVNGSANGKAAFANAGVPRIPRATTANSWDSRTNLEMTPSNSRQNLVPVGRNSRLYEDHDDMNPYAQARPQSSLYAQARPQNNPYAQNRPQINPYASSQGQTNPYYTHDDGRRFN